MKKCIMSISKPHINTYYYTINNYFFQGAMTDILSGTFWVHYTKEHNEFMVNLCIMCLINELLGVIKYMIKKAPLSGVRQGHDYDIGLLGVLQNIGVNILKQGVLLYV